MLNLNYHYDNAFNHLGIAAIYNKKPITILFSASDEQFELGDGRLVNNLANIKIRDKDAPSPIVGEIIKIDNNNYKIISEPLKNSNSKVWSILSMQC